MSPLIREMAGYLPDAEKYMWFDLGVLPTDEMKFVVDGDELTLLPFKEIMICCIDSDGDKCGLALLTGADSVAAAGFVFKGNSFHEVNAFAYMVTPDGLMLLPAREGRPEPRREDCLSVLCTVKYMQDQLGRKSLEAHRPVIKKGFVNDKRRRKGKKPLFDWHTVTIEPAAPKADPQGGHHASPRKHDRRGHWRTMRSGKKAWVKNCVVGSAALGVVFKDYKVAAL